MRWQYVWLRFRRERFIQAMAAVMVVLGALALVGPLFVPDPEAQDLPNRLAEPSWLGGHGLLGTDQLGRDLAARIVYGLRTSYIVGILAVLLATTLGTALGVMAGYLGGRFDAAIMRLVDLQLSLPSLILMMALIVVTEGGMTILIVGLGLTAWTLHARFVRSVVLRYRSTDFIAATRALGAGPARIILAHVFPNVLGLVVAVSTLEFARIMLAEAGLSFLGFGVQEPTISLGAIMASGREYLASQWWITTFSGLTLALAVLSLNLVGSWLQRVSDPRTDLERARTNAQQQLAVAATPVT